MSPLLLLALMTGGATLQAEPQPTLTARQLFDEALEVLEARPLGRERVDWKKVRAELTARVPDSKTPADAHPAIQQAVAALKDRHARFAPPMPASDPTTTPTASSAGPSSQDATEAPRRVVPTVPEGRLVDGVAYVVVPTCAAPDVEGLRRYAASLRGLLLDLEKQQPRGWIVELRFNGGGNVWPMLIGLWPMLGDGVLTGSHDGTTPSQVGCDGLSAFLQRGDGPRETQLTIDEVAGDRRLTTKPVAVLIGPWTMSSGEMTALALAGHPGARLFGEPTGGLTTATEYFPLRDGSVLNLPVSRMTDRQGRVAAETIEPHERIESADWPSVDDAVALAARRWVAEQAAKR